MNVEGIHLFVNMRFSQAIAAAILTFSVQVQAASWIVPGAVWTDTKGVKIDAHGGNVVKRGDTFYWVGQSASNSMFLLFSFPSCFYKLSTGSLVFWQERLD